MIHWGYSLQWAVELAVYVPCLAWAWRQMRSEEYMKKRMVAAAPKLVRRFCFVIFSTLVFKNIDPWGLWLWPYEVSRFITYGLSVAMTLALVYCAQEVLLEAFYATFMKKCPPAIKLAFYWGGWFMGAASLTLYCVAWATDTPGLMVWLHVLGVMGVVVSFGLDIIQVKRITGMLTGLQKSIMKDPSKIKRDPRLCKIIRFMVHMIVIWWLILVPAYTWEFYRYAYGPNQTQWWDPKGFKQYSWGDQIFQLHFMFTIGMATAFVRVPHHWFSKHTEDRIQSFFRWTTMDSRGSTDGTRFSSFFRQRVASWTSNTQDSRISSTTGSADSKRGSRFMSCDQIISEQSMGSRMESVHESDFENVESIAEGPDSTFDIASYGDSRGSTLESQSMPSVSEMQSTFDSRDVQSTMESQVESIGSKVDSTYRADSHLEIEDV